MFKGLEMSVAVEALKIAGSKRESVGGISSRRLRQEGFIPAVMYGSGTTPVSFSISYKEFALLRKAVGSVLSHLFELNIDKEPVYAILKEVQRDIVSSNIIHLDFQKVDPSSSVRVDIPIKIVGEEECNGLKQGGVLNVGLRSIKLWCPPLSIPNVIEIDISSLVIGDTIHLGALKLSEGVRFVAGFDEDSPIISILARESAEESEGSTGSEGSGDEESA